MLLYRIVYPEMQNFPDTQLSTEIQPDLSFFEPRRSSIEERILFIPMNIAGCGNAIIKFSVLFSNSCFPQLVQNGNQQKTAVI